MANVLKRFYHFRLFSHFTQVSMLSCLQSKTGGILRLGVNIQTTICHMLLIHIQ